MSFTFYTDKGSFLCSPCMANARLIITILNKILNFVKHNNYINHDYKLSDVVRDQVHFQTI